MTAKALLMAAIVVSLVDGGAGLRGASVKAAGAQQTSRTRTSSWKRRELVQRLERVVQSADARCLRRAR